MFTLEDKANIIVSLLKQKGWEAYFAGGCVRDKLLGLEPKDFDIATSANPEQVEATFPKTIPVGKCFGVIIVDIAGDQFEVATFRNDGEYLNGRHPENVIFSTAEEDAKRRDFTINGMFFNPVTKEVIDFVGGKKDLENKIVRFIGNPERRVEEDKLRMLRLVRFAVKLNFKVDENSLFATIHNAKKIKEVSQERITDEIMKILKIHNATQAFSLLLLTKLLKEVLPEVDKLIGCEQDKIHHPEGDVFTHTVMVMENLPKDASDELILAGLFHDIGKPATFEIKENGKIATPGHENVGADITETIMRRMKFPTKTIVKTKLFVANHMKFMVTPKMRKSRLKRFFQLDNFQDLLVLHKADCMGRAKEPFLDYYNFVVEKMNEVDFTPEKISPPRLITGHDLIVLGLDPGPKFKEILLAVEDLQLEGKIKTKEMALGFVRNFLKDN